MNCNQNCNQNCNHASAVSHEQMLAGSARNRVLIAQQAHSLSVCLGLETERAGGTAAAARAFGPEPGMNGRSVRVVASGCDHGLAEADAAVVGRDP